MAAGPQQSTASASLQRSRSRGLRGCCQLCTGASGRSTEPLSWRLLVHWQEEPASILCMSISVKAMRFPGTRIFEQYQGQAYWLPCRGIKGVSFSDGLDKREAFPQRPAYGSPDIETSPYAEVHSSIHRLLAGVKAAEVGPETA